MQTSLWRQGWEAEPVATAPRGMQKGVGRGLTRSRGRCLRRKGKLLEDTVPNKVAWERVKLDEGFFGEIFAEGQVRSDYEINVESGYSGWDLGERL